MSDGDTSVDPTVQIQITAPVAPNVDTPAPFQVRMQRNPLLNRDPSGINDLVKVRFEDVFAEPEGSHSFDVIWEVSGTVFTVSKLWCYRILGAICAVPCAFCWGIHFACLTFCYVWDVVPQIKSFSINLFACGKIWGLCIRSFVDPCFESIGKIFGNINVSVSKSTVEKP